MPLTTAYARRRVIDTRYGWLVIEGRVVSATGEISEEVSGSIAAGSGRVMRVAGGREVEGKGKKEMRPYFCGDEVYMRVLNLVLRMMMMRILSRVA